LVIKAFRSPTDPAAELAGRLSDRGAADFAAAGTPVARPIPRNGAERRCGARGCDDRTP